MTANLYEQTQEIGIMRSLGLKAKELKRLYFYEALIMVFAGSILGICVGTILSFTMVL